MAKKSIKSFDEFMKIAVDAAFGEKAEFSREMWEESLKQRYENDEITFRVRDFDNGNIIRDKSVLELFSNMDRLDDYIKYEKDIVNKTAAISTRHVVSAGLDDLLNQFTYSAVNKIYDKLAEEYDISENVSAEYKNNLGKYLPKGEIRDEKTPVSEVRFGQLNASEKSDVYNSIVSTFFDRDAWKDKDGNVIEPSKAAKEALDKVVSFVERMEKDALSGDALSANLEYYDDELAKENVKELAKAFEDEDELKFSENANRLANFKNNVTSFAAGNSQDLDEVHLELDQSLHADFTIDEFVQNQKDGKLSHIELDWAESNLDRMVNSLYTKDELRELKQAGFDPTMGVLIDGKPIKPSFETMKVENTPLEDAQVKSSIVSKALQGSKIDICKLKLNEDGSLDVENITPVKTDANLKPRRWSFIRWLKELFGFEPKVMDKIKEANESERGYTQYYEQKRELEKQAGNAKALEKPEEVLAAERSAAPTKARIANAETISQYEKYSKDFFERIVVDGNVFTEKNLGSAFQYTDIYGSEKLAIKTIGRMASNVSMGFLFGLSKGYTFDELTAPENSELRRTVGRQFVEELNVKSYDSFLETMDKGLHEQYKELNKIEADEYNEKIEREKQAKKGVEVKEPTKAEILQREARKEEIRNNLKDSQKLYGKYLIERKEKIEGFCVHSAEALKKLPISVVSPFNTEAFIENHQRLNFIGTMVKDWSQSLEVLGHDKNWFAPTIKSVENVAPGKYHVKPAPVKIDYGFSKDEINDVKKLSERTAAVFDYYSDLNSIALLKSHSDKYLEFIENSNNYATFDPTTIPKILASARAKTALQYASENIKEGSTISDVIANTKLGSVIGGLYLNAEFTNDSENVSKVFLEHILNNNHPETPNARLVNADLEKEPKTKEKPEFQSNLVDTGMRLVGRYNVNGVEKVASMKLEFEDLVKNSENARNNLNEFLKPVRTQDMSVLEAYDKLIEQTHSAEKTVEVKSISEEKTAPQKQKMTFAELSQTEKPKLTTKPAPQKKAPEKKLGMNL